MTTVVFDFPGGLYHATPWGNHVNEGQVEWPPSPWRLLRSFISTGYTACGWDDGVPPVGRSLIEALATVEPIYTLPPAGVAHTRHFMPTGTSTTLVFDAFARPGNGELSVTWPVVLATDQRKMLSELVSRLNYLGRSESWVQGRLLPEGEALPVGAVCAVSTAAEVPAEAWEPITLLAVESVRTYETWRKEFAAQTKSKVFTPPMLWDCLTQTTSQLQKDGWSLPPGSKRVVYRRRKNALTVAVPPRIRKPTATYPTVVLLSVSLPSGNLHALPPTTRTLPQAELLHQAAVAHLGRGVRVTEGLELVGRKPSGGVLTGPHDHSHILPLDLDADGHLDHMMIWAPGGFGPRSLNAIRSLKATYAKKTNELRLSVAVIGSLESLRAVTGTWGDALKSVIGPSQTWVSATPFLPPRYLKRSGKNTLEGQVQAELESRRLPAATNIRVLSRDETLEKGFRHFVRVRQHGGKASKTGLWFGLEITFAEPIKGPLSLGYASHFGMGRFAAKESE